MALRFTFFVPGDDLAQIDTSFGNLRARVKDLRPVWPGVHSELREAAEKQFATEGRHGSGGWRPLSPGYAAEKLSRFGVKPILEATGRLMRGLTGRDKGSHVNVQKPLEFRFGVRDAAVPYAKYHQAGTSKMPRRRPIELTAAERKAIERLISHHVRIEEVRARRAGP